MLFLNINAWKFVCYDNIFVNTDWIKGKLMLAEKVILETNQDGEIIGLPKLPPIAKLETIFFSVKSKS